MPGRGCCYQQRPADQPRIWIFTRPSLVSLREPRLRINTGADGRGAIAQEQVARHSRGARCSARSLAQAQIASKRFMGAQVVESRSSCTPTRTLSPMAGRAARVGA